MREMFACDIFMSELALDGCTFGCLFFVSCFSDTGEWRLCSKFCRFVSAYTKLILPQCNASGYNSYGCL